MVYIGLRFEFISKFLETKASESNGWIDKNIIQAAEKAYDEYMAWWQEEVQKKMDQGWAEFTDRVEWLENRTQELNEEMARKTAEWDDYFRRVEEGWQDSWDEGMQKFLEENGLDKLGADELARVLEETNQKYHEYVTIPVTEEINKWFQDNSLVNQIEKIKPWMEEYLDPQKWLDEGSKYLDQGVGYMVNTIIGSVYNIFECVADIGSLEGPDSDTGHYMDWESMELKEGSSPQDTKPWYDWSDAEWNGAWDACSKDQWDRQVPQSFLPSKDQPILVAQVS